MNKFKSVVKKISPFVGKYKWAFLGAILFIISAAIFTAIAPRTEGLIITQLTKDFEGIIRGVSGASVNFNYIFKVLILLFLVYAGGSYVIIRARVKSLINQGLCFLNKLKYTLYII